MLLIFLAFVIALALALFFILERLNDWQNRKKAERAKKAAEARTRARLDSVSKAKKAAEKKILQTPPAQPRRQSSVDGIMLAFSA